MAGRPTRRAMKPPMNAAVRPIAMVEIRTGSWSMAPSRSTGVLRRNGAGPCHDDGCLAAPPYPTGGWPCPQRRDSWPIRVLSGRSQLHPHLVHVAPHPVLAGFERLDERMPGRVEMGGGVATRALV